MQVQRADMDFLSTNGYISVMQKEEYDQATADVTKMDQMSVEQRNEAMERMAAEDALEEEERKTHSIRFYFEAKEKKEAEREKEESERSVVSKEDAELAQRDSAIRQLIQKKSMLDRMVQYGGVYLALTGLGVITLNDLNIRNYRVSDSEFSDFVEQSRQTAMELRSIVQRGSFHESNFATEFPDEDPSQLWSVAIGLAKLQGDEEEISHRFLLALAILHHFKSTNENKMMAAEIMTASRAEPSQTGANSDLWSLSTTLDSLDNEIRHDAKVPKQLSAGVAATIMFGKRFDGTYPTDKFLEFSKMTSSFESAAILSVVNVPSDQLAAKFQSFRALFSSWGYQMSEDTELASAFLATSELGPDDVRLKMTIILDALKTYLEYPVVAAALLASIATLEAHETLDLMEKATDLLGGYAAGLERSELVSLAVRMIHGIENELVKKLDPTAKVTNTPVQFTYAPSGIFFMYYAPLIVAHSSYYSTFSGIGGSHPAHVHGVGGFMG